MKTKQTPATFRPLTIVIETQDELDQLLSILDGVARNLIQHSPQVVTVAKRFYGALAPYAREDD